MQLARVFAIAATLAAVGACSVQYVDLGVMSGKRAFAITCGNDYARCETQAAELCPDGFDRTHSRRVSKHDQRALGGLKTWNEKEHRLTIECDATDEKK